MASSVVGDTVTLAATHDDVDLRSYANADTDGLYANADAGARIQYDSINAGADVAAGARVAAVDLNVVSTQSINRYDRYATADVDVFGDETVTRRPAISWRSARSPGTAICRCCRVPRPNWSSLPTALW